jgi:hypothetical protein
MGTDVEVELLEGVGTATDIRPFKGQSDELLHIFYLKSSSNLYLRTSYTFAFNIKVPVLSFLSLKVIKFLLYSTLLSKHGVLKVN